VAKVYIPTPLEVPPAIWVDTDGIVHVRNSERGTFGRCPQQWWWNWRDGLRPKETAKPLWFGTAIHEALAHYYKRGYKRASLGSTLEKFKASADMEAEYIKTNLGIEETEEWVDARALGEAMLTGYVERWEGDKTWDVIATEQSFEVAIPYLGKDDRSGPIVQHILKNYGDYFIFNGTFDGVYRDKRDNRIKLMEHKTAASISIGHLPMDNQAGAYWMIAQSVGRSQGWLGNRDNISEITYNFLRKALPDSRPTDADGYYTNKPTKDHYIAALDPYVEWETTRTGSVKFPTIAVLEEMAVEHGLTVVGDRSKTQPPPLFERHPVRKRPAMRKSQVARLRNDVIRMHAYVDGWLAVDKTPDRNHCGFCPFKEMCELHESGAGWVEFRDAMYRHEDPYAGHRKSA
jgi:hypothetical protein